MNKRGTRACIRDSIKQLNSCKRSQAWGIDISIASIIFIIGIIMFYLYTVDQQGGDGGSDSMFEQGEVLADYILSEGYPENWNSTNVEKIGILNGNKINETKLENFYALSKSDYLKTRSLLKTRYHYWFFLSESMIINSAEVEGIGLKPSSEDNLARITRLTIYQNRPVTAYFYIWG